MVFLSPLLLLSSLLAYPVLGTKTTLDPHTHRELLLNGRPQIGLWKSLLKEQKTRDEQAKLSKIQDNIQRPFYTSSKPLYEAHCFPQKISHFDDTVNGTFCQRYWIDTSFYREGGPVFLLDGGETSGQDRVPFLEKGILQILSNATGGIGIVLEHRYYGESVPVDSFSTDDLRFLNNKEALEDSAYFIENFEPPSSIRSLSSSNALHPNNTAWIYYGGSYAGARAAHMRKEYPHLVWGAIASSAVTHAQINFPQYYDPIQRYAPENCINTLQAAIELIDHLLDQPEPIPRYLKGLFGLEELLSNEDFADVISGPLGYWQAKNWDPKVGSNEFYSFCDSLTAKGASSKLGLIRIPASIIYYGKYIKENVVARCPRSEGKPASDIEDCFGTSQDSKFRETDLEQTWRLWIFQVCTQWGYFMPAPLEGPRIISNKLTLEYTSKICRQAFPPGKHFTVPEWPDVEEVNQRGDYEIEYDRLAFIDGDRDPWRPMTPQSDWAPRRKSSVNRPVHLIFDGVHHYDENGLEDHSKEPPRIKDVHELEINFIQEWIAQFNEQKENIN
ncbi:serine carboxypeptidase [Kwoniella mangroviensis CBS 10435]|uniref:Serine carboxypeptidase n=1 Tax=Kwoniella mangroviensis CBS 10435 TaxID=1331196 RepID=A0A1B9ILG7_9TREE|nr:serine carboxypeptidase [Kwoniella mangroviensis CBS 10435]